jgi:hypothetical protein
MPGTCICYRYCSSSVSSVSSASSVFQGLPDGMRFRAGFMGAAYCLRLEPHDTERRDRPLETFQREFASGFDVQQISSGSQDALGQ